MHKEKVEQRRREGIGNHSNVSIGVCLNLLKEKAVFGSSGFSVFGQFNLAVISFALKGLRNIA